MNTERDALNFLEEEIGKKEKRAVLTFDRYLALIDRTELPFEPDGTPKMPSWEPPNPEVERRIASWLSDPALRTRLDELISRKREEWNARESDRKLVD